MAEKGYVYAKAANGMMVRIPEDKYPRWKEIQDQKRAGTYKRTPEQEELRQKLLSKLKGEMQ